MDRAKASRCQALQIFTKSAGQWRARALPAEEIALFRAGVDRTGIHPVVAHNSYLINLAAAAPALRAQSLAALGEELDRAESLGLQGLVMHPGSYTTGTEHDGLRLIGDGLAALLAARQRGRGVLSTAGQGRSGHRFEHLARSRAGRWIPTRRRSLDTCQILASGYDCADEGSSTFQELDRIVGLERVKVFHLNDSKKPCGSRVDRHEHIGKGCLGLEPFRRLLNDPRFRTLPMLLETPKLETPASKRRSDVDPWDARNLRTLRGLIETA